MKTIIDKNKALSLLKRSLSGQVMKSFSLELQDDFDIALEAVSIHGYALQFVSERLSNNQDIVKLAVIKNQLALKYAGNEIKNNPEFILQILEPNISSGELWKFISPELQKNKDFALSFLKKNAFALKFFPHEWKSDREIAITALNTNEFAFTYIKKSLRDTEEITKRALNISYNFSKISKKYQNDESMALFAIEKSPMNMSETFSEFSHLGTNLKNSKAFFLKFIQEKPLIFEYASDNLKKDCDLLKIVLSSFGHKIEHSFSNYKELLEPMIYQNANLLKFASDDIKNDRKIILKTLLKNLNNFRFVGDEIKNMLGNKSFEYIPKLKIIISIEELAEKLDSNLVQNNTNIKVKTKI